MAKLVPAVRLANRECKDVVARDDGGHDQRAMPGPYHTRMGIST
jgi:hypothetical protein